MLRIEGERGGTLWMVGIGGEEGGGALSLIYTTGLIITKAYFFSFLCIHTAVQSIFDVHELGSLSLYNRKRRWEC